MYSKVVFILSVVTLAACSHVPSPVTEINVLNGSVVTESESVKAIAIIQPNDTLYSIGFKNNVDVKDLLAWNGIADARSLQVGQRIRLTRPENYIEQRFLPALNSNIEAVPIAKTQNQPEVGVESQSRTDKKQLPTIVSVKPKQTEDSRDAVYFQETNSIKWSWPVKGQVIGWFSPAKSRKGLDIRTTVGQQVKTTAPGKVVYQGSGIKGYGNLIIIKHSIDMLSAYAYNDKVFVSEGDYVEKDKVISLAGSRKGEPMLHFEIRKKGKPVNPMKYLR